MTFHGQKILPAIRSMKDFDKMLDTPFTYGVFLDLHIGMLKSVFLNMLEDIKKICSFT